jgi:hypothetical protein
MSVVLASLKKAAVLDLKKGNLDKAVEKVSYLEQKTLRFIEFIICFNLQLQKLVRISSAGGSSDDAAASIPLWLLLGESYVGYKC